MRPAEFTKDEIIRAGQELLDAGRNITGFALRQKIGGGNPNRLKQVWEEHIASQRVVKVESVADLPIEVSEELVAVSKALTERLSVLAVELNDKAVKAAERRTTEVIRTAGEQMEQAERELIDAAQTVEDLEDKLAMSSATVIDLENYIARLKEINQKQLIELTQLQERMMMVESAHKAEIDRKDEEIDKIKHTAHEASARHKRDMADLTAELSESRKATKTANDELTALKIKATAATEIHQDYRKQVAAETQRTADRIVKLENAADAARNESKKAREEAATLRGQVQTLNELLSKSGAKIPK